MKGTALADETGTDTLSVLVVIEMVYSIVILYQDACIGTPVCGKQDNLQRSNMPSVVRRSRAFASLDRSGLSSSTIGHHEHLEA